MSDEETTAKAEPTSKPEKRPMSATVRLVIVVLAVLVLLLLVSWGGNYRAEATRRAAFGKGVDALSASMTSSALEPDAGKLRRLVESIREAGGYVSVTVADKNGLVVASTDKNLPGRKLEDLRERKSDGGTLFAADVRSTKDGLQATRGIYVAGAKAEGNSLLAWLRVVANP